jgi:hypothetical protein
LSSDLKECEAAGAALEDLQVQLAVILQQQEQVYKQLTEVRSNWQGVDALVLSSRCMSACADPIHIYWIGFALLIGSLQRLDTALWSVRDMKQLVV